MSITLEDLVPGERYMHCNHGVEIFYGIKDITEKGKEGEYVELAYAGNDKLYVPVEQLGMISKICK
mgnify:CR=1 FL=1